MKRFLCVLLAATVAVTGLSACRKQPDVDVHSAADYTVFPTALTAYEAGTISRPATPAAGGLYYIDNGQYGIMTYDGVTDSGAIYALCRPIGNYFTVAKTTGTSVSTMNTAGVVDAKGNVLVPLKYASVVEVGERFVMVAELTGFTENKDESVTSRTDNSGNKVYYTGNWYLYDLTTGEKIPGATGTHPYASYSYGDQYVKFVTDDKQQHIVTPDGTPLPENAVHLNNGYYIIEADHALYNGAGTKLFTYDSNGYIPCNGEGVSGYILAKKTTDGTNSYVLMDEQGTVVSQPLPDKPKTYGDLLLVDGQAYNNKGQLVLEGNFSAAYMDPMTQRCWLLNSSATKEKVMLDSNGKVLYRGTDENVKFLLNHFFLYKNDNDVQLPYVIAQETFVETGTAIAPWLVRYANEDGTFRLMDTISGNTLLEGHASYAAALIYENMMYVYAENADGTLTAYRIM